METLNSKLFLASAVIVLQSVAQIFLKIGVNKDSIHFLVPINNWTTAGYFCIVVNFIFWMQYLKIEKLNVATAAISLIYILIPFFSMIFLKESLNFKMILGFALIAAGIALTQFENV